MIIGNRQAYIDCSELGEITRDNSPDIAGFESLEVMLSNSIFKKMYPNEEDLQSGKFFKKLIDDSIVQTISVLKKNKLIKTDGICPKNIELWKEIVPMSPFYEGLCCAIKTSLIKHHFPKMYDEMMKGQYYSHYSLTTIGECVLYTMEFFEKEKLFVSKPPQNQEASGK